MTIVIALEDDEIFGGIDRKKADALARRIARTARAKAIVTWNPTCMVGKEMYADIAYKLTYEVAFVKAIAKQKGKRFGFK
jgi:hypothetical protein